MDVLIILGVLVVALIVGAYAWAAASIFLGTIGILIVGLVAMFLPAMIGIPLGLYWYVNVNEGIGNVTVLAAIVANVLWFVHLRKQNCTCPIHQVAIFADWYEQKFKI
jgi:hypothetical protein